MEDTAPAIEDISIDTDQDIGDILTDSDTEDAIEDATEKDTAVKLYYNRIVLFKRDNNLINNNKAKSNV
jgi:hypothetical protein